MNPFSDWIFEGWAIVLELAVLGLGLYFALGRKTLDLFSRKSLLLDVPEHRRERITRYLDFQDEYHICLRLFDNGVRLFLTAWIISAVDGARFAEAGWLMRGVYLVTIALSLILAIAVPLELVPAVLARRCPERLLTWMLPTLHRFYLLVSGPMAIYQRVVQSGARLLGSPPEREAAEMVGEEILTAAEEGGREGILQKTEIFMIEAILKLNQRRVEEVLTPRTEMVALDVETEFQECVRLARECGHSRIPVYRESKDTVIGILYVKDLLKFLDDENVGPRRLEEILRKPHFVRETKLVSELFQEFKTQRFHIAVVLDEFGGTEGLITIEDIIEEILGEIEEESPSPEAGAEPTPQFRFERTGESRVEVDARLAIHELNRELGKAFGGEFPPEVPLGEGVETVGGYLSSQLGRIPSPGEEHQEGGLKFRVLEADERSVGRLEIEILAAPTTGEA